MRGGARGSAQLLDPEWGGFGARRRSSRRPRRSSCCCGAARRELAVQTLDGMAAGGMYDLVGGGFHRYSVDERWLVPHFEKMLYDNALLVPAYLHGWLVTGERALPRGRRGDGRVPAPRPAPARRRVRLLAGRGHRRRRGADVHVDARARACRRSCSSRSSTAARSSAASSTRSCGRGCSRSARSARSPVATTRRSPPGTGSRSRRWPRPGGGCERADWIDAARALAEFLLGAALGRTVGSSAASARARRAAPASSTTTPTSRTGSTSCTSRPASCAGSRSRAGWRGSRSSSSRDDERGGFFLAPADGEQLVARHEGPRRQPGAVGELDARLRAAAARADLRRRRARAARGRRAAARRATRSAAGAVGVRLGALRARPLPRRRRASSRSSARRTTTVARAALAPFEPNAVVAFGPAEDVPLLAGQGRSSTASRPSTSASASPARRR